MEKKKQPFSNQVRKYKRILYDLFVTIENVIIGNSTITRSFQDGCDKYTIRSHSNQPNVLLVYEETTSVTCISESNISSMEMKREDSPQIEIVKTNEQTTNINTKKGENNNSLSEVIGQQEKHISENIPNLSKIQSMVSYSANMNVTALKAIPKQTHAGKKLHKCGYCEKTFPFLSRKVNHERQHTGEKPYKCQYCEKPFAKLKVKKIHERLHTGEKPYKCGYCEKAFHDLSNKLSHERQHTGEKPYKCQYCEKPFANLSVKKCHERLHTGEKPYRCGYCEKTFVQSDHKVRHERRHTREKSYKCEYCAKTFSYLSAKKTHERRHTEEKPYKIDYCEKTFTQISD